MWQMTSLAGAVPIVFVGMLALGLMPVWWKHLELTGRSLGHIPLDFSFVSLVGGCGAGLLFWLIPDGLWTR